MTDTTPWTLFTRFINREEADAMFSTEPKAVDVLSSRRWVAEISVSANGMHEIREGAVNELSRPLVGFALTYALAEEIASAHNSSAAVADLIEAAAECDRLESVFPCPEDRVADLIGDPVEYHTKMQAAYARRTAALARVGGAG